MRYNLEMEGVLLSSVERGVWSNAAAATCRQEIFTIVSNKYVVSSDDKYALWTS